MRSSAGFIEVTGKTNGRKILVNKSAIIFVTKSDVDDENAVIVTTDGDRSHRIVCKETYKDVAEEIFWFGASNIASGLFSMETEDDKK